MKYKIIAALPGQEPKEALLTTEHSASSYGLPVVVIDGHPYGFAEVEWIDGNEKVRKTAAKYGYRIRREVL